MFSERRDMKAAKAFFRSATATMEYRPERVTTDGHGSYPRAIRTALRKAVRHRTSACLNNRLEQDHRGIKGRIRCIRGLESHDAAARFRREHGELRDLLRPRRRHNQLVSASRRRARFAKAARIALDIATAALTALVFSFRASLLARDLTEPFRPARPEAPFHAAAAGVSRMGLQTMGVQVE